MEPMAMLPPALAAQSDSFSERGILSWSKSEGCIDTGADAVYLFGLCDG
jgi:hypothetical protein